MARLALVAAAAAVLVLAAVCAEPLCSFTNGQYYARDDIMACFLSVPFDEEVRIQTLDTLNKTKELYAFVDIVHNSPDPNLPLHVDIGAELSRIARTDYQTDFDFHDDIRAVYTSLGDAHTQYYAPICYRNFLIRQPIPPAYYVDAKGRGIIAVSRYMSDDLVEYFKSSRKIDITSLVGLEIAKIDGAVAIEYLDEYAQNHIGMSKDPGTRFHLAMTQPQPQPNFDVAASSYWQTRTKRNPLPESDTVQYTFKYPNGTTFDLEFEWTYQALKTYSGYDDFMKDYWAVPATADEPALAKNEPGNVKVSPSAVRPSPRAPSSSGYTLLTNTVDVYFWALADGETCVMYLNTMAPESHKTSDTIDKGFNMCADLGLTRLIIDLTNNGGGNICFGQSLLAYLQGHGPGLTIWGPQDLPLSPLQANLTYSAVDLNVSSTVWSPGFYKDEDGNHVDNSDYSVFMPGIERERGGLTRGYSTLLHINQCGGKLNFIDAPRFTTADKTIMITHGFCGSTCALFANHLAIYDGVRTVVAGGPSTRSQQQYTSFPGLQVLDDPELFREFDLLGADTTPARPTPDEVVPRRLPTQANFRYCIREIYPPDIVTSDIPPMEFNFQAATYKIVDTFETAENPYLLWNTVANMI